MVLRRGASHLPAQGTRRRGGRSGPGPSRPDPAGPGRPSPPQPRPEPAWDPAPRAHGRPRKPAPGQVQKSRAEASLSETERRPRPAGPGPPLPRRPRRAGSALGRRGLGEEQQRTARGSKATGGPAATARFARQRPSWTRHFPAGLEPLRPAGSAAPATPARKRFLFCFFSPPPFPFLPRGSFRLLSAFGGKKKKKRNLRAFLFHPSHLLLTLVFGELAPNSHKFPPKTSRFNYREEKCRGKK